MEHLRPNGLSRGYYCPICGQISNMFGMGHGVNVCVSNPELVKQLRELNKAPSHK